jgi:hypothetical protein
MKKIIVLLAALSLFSFPSCKKEKEKKKYTCGSITYYISVFVILKGFSSDQLDSVIIRTYEPNGQFDHILSTDTFNYSNASFLSDTAYPQDLAGKVGFYELVKGKEYQFEVLSTNQTYKISNIRDGATSSSWEQEEPCSGGGGSGPKDFQPELMDIDGQPANAFRSTVNTPLVCLNH